MLQPFSKALHLLQARVQAMALAGHDAWLEHIERLYNRATLNDESG